MLLKPDEITTLKKGSQTYVEIYTEDIRILKRNFCGVYELSKENSDRNTEYFEDLILFKNKYGSTQRKFPLYNLNLQKTHIYALSEKLDLKTLFKWFSLYGELSLINTTKIDSIKIDNYKWISYTEKSISYLSVATISSEFKINIYNFVNKKTLCRSL